MMGNTTTKKKINGQHGRSYSHSTHNNKSTKHKHKYKSRHSNDDKSVKNLNINKVSSISNGNSPHLTNAYGSLNDVPNISNKNTLNLNSNEQQQPFAEDDRTSDNADSGIFEKR